ncbi:MAG: glycosyltransferase family 4 protein [Candidatus Woesearchaeota archaeon]
MKITIATGIYPPDIGGPATFLREFVPFLRKNGWKVEIITYGEPRKDAVAISHDNPVKWWSFYRAVLKSARDSDVIFATDTFSAGWPASRAAIKLRKRLVVRFVGDAAWEIARSNGWTDDPFEVFQKKKYDWKIEWLRRVQRKVLYRADVITVSHFLESILKKWGIKSVVVPNAVSPVNLPSKKILRKKFGFDNKFVVLNVGRITRYKGVDKIIRMCAKLRKDIPELLLVVVGDGPAFFDAQKAAHEENVSHIVRFEGIKNENETRALMKAADVLVLNSEYEGMSHTLLEAMSVELPIIASDVCGNPELVKNRGLLFEYNNMDALKECILKYYKDPELAKKFVAKYKQLPPREEIDKKYLAFLKKV